MPTYFFKINTTDLTAYVDIQNHKVNSSPVYETWTDGNYIEHREIVRQKISGKTKLGFETMTDFNAFLALLSSEQNLNGYYPITVYVNNTNTEAVINAFLELEGEAKWNIVNGRQWIVQTVTITQR